MEIDRLRARIDWLDRWRRVAAVMIVLVELPAMLAWHLEDDWPKPYVVGVLAALSAITWFVAECGLGLGAAIWEARHDALVRQRLPIAVWRRRRRR